jgi:hypothetical protein
MKLAILAARVQEADRRIIAAANELSSYLELPWPDLNQTNRDAQVQQLFRAEALADFLEVAVSHLTVHVDSENGNEAVGYPTLTADTAQKAFTKDELAAHLAAVLGVSAEVLADLTKAEFVALMELTPAEAREALEDDGPAQ